MEDIEAHEDINQCKQDEPHFTPKRSDMLFPHLKATTLTLAISKNKKSREDDWSGICNGD